MKPKQFQRCGIHLPVNNLQETLSYYRDQLGLSGQWTSGEKDGGLQRDNMRLLFVENRPYTEKINDANNRINLLWFVDNDDEIFTEFEEKSIEIASNLKDYTYGMREFAFIDINGYYIRIAEKIEEK